MAELIGITGLSGTGKSSSLANLDPDKSFLINVINKKLPFKGSKSKFNVEKQNYFATDNWEQIISTLLWIKENPRNIETIVLDDSTYIISNEFMNRASEKGFDKFTSIAVHYKKILDVAASLPDNMKVYVISHSELDDDGNYKIKTVGKLLDQQVNLAGLFTTLLYSYVEEGSGAPSYKFVTNKMGPYQAKSPAGMFDTTLIDNDLNLVNQKIDEYYN